jgi:hypothetical protein
MTPTPPHIVARINAFLQAKGEPLACLRDRWQDERAYEDFADYVKAAEAMVPDDFAFHALTKSPFALRFSVDGFDAQYALVANARSVAWKRLK